MANLPERIRIIWPHHRLCGTELVVHGWVHIDGEIHLRLTLTDGSVGCLPAAWTDLFTAAPDLEPQQSVTLAGIRSLRRLVEALSARHVAGDRSTSTRSSA